MDRLDIYLSTIEPEPSGTVAAIEKSAIEDDIPIIRKRTRNLLGFIIRSGHPGNILEIGTGVGFSAVYMSELADKDTCITTVEKDKSRFEKACNNIKIANKEKSIIPILGDAAHILKGLEQKFDLIFMDAAKGQYVNFLDDVLRLLSDDGVLFSDNVLRDGDILESRYALRRRDRTIHSRMREYLAALESDERLYTCVLPVEDGVALSVRRRSI